MKTIFVDADTTYSDLRAELNIELEFALRKEIDDFVRTGKWPYNYLTIEPGKCPSSLEPALLVEIDYAPSKTGATVDLSQWLHDAWNNTRADLEEEYSEETEDMTPDEADEYIRRVFVGRESDYSTDWTNPLDLFPDRPLDNVSAEIDAAIAAVLAMETEENA